MIMVLFLACHEGKRSTGLEKGFYKSNSKKVRSAEDISSSKFNQRKRSQILSYHLQNRNKPSVWFVFKSFWLTLAHPTYYADVLRRELKAPKSIFKRKKNNAIA
jgi:hypothetical protein